MQILMCSLVLVKMGKKRDIRGQAKIGELRESLREARVRWLGYASRRSEHYVENRVKQNGGRKTEKDR